MTGDSERKTPLTDAAMQVIAGARYGEQPEAWQQLAELARRLEKERDAAKADATEMLGMARQFITGSTKLPCLAEETDRQCFNRCKTELLQRIDAAMQTAADGKEPT